MNREEIIAIAVKKYGKSICTDQIEEALKATSIDEAVDILIADSEYWDYL